MAQTAPTHLARLRAPHTPLQALLCALLLCLGPACSGEPAAPPPEAPPPAAEPAAELPAAVALDPIRISYTIHDGVFFWGMVSQVFERTDVLRRNGLEGQFVRCDNSPGLGWSVVYGDADVSLITTGVMGVTMICGRPYKVVSTLGSGGRNALIVAADSDITSIPQLRGKLIENPILGGLLERFLTGAGVDPSEVEIALHYSYMGESVRRLLEGEIDALMHWDPYLVPLERDGSIRILIHDPYHLEVIAQNMLLEQRPEVAERFMVALLQAMHFALVNPELTAGWYAQVSGTPVDATMGAMPWCEPAEHFEQHPGTEGVRIVSTEQHLADVRGVIGAMGGFGVFDDLRPKIAAAGLPDAQPLPGNDLDVGQFLDTELAARAEARYRAEGFDPASLTITGIDPDATWLHCTSKLRLADRQPELQH
jgi:ABC-type nitrate/sulfonate/bicarbonate transport system substrate-binding protein